MKTFNRILSTILLVLGVYGVFFYTHDKYAGVISLLASMVFENKAKIIELEKGKSNE